MPRAACHVEPAVPAHSRASAPLHPKRVCIYPTGRAQVLLQPRPVQYSLLGLGWLLRLLGVGDDEVNGRVRLLEQCAQLCLDLLGPAAGEEQRQVRQKNGAVGPSHSLPCTHSVINSR